MELLLMLGAVGLAYVLFSGQMKQSHEAAAAAVSSAPEIPKKRLYTELAFDALVPQKVDTGLLKGHGLPVALVSEVAVAHPKISDMGKAVAKLKALYDQGNANGLLAMEVAAKGHSLPEGHGIWFALVAYKDGSYDVRSFVAKV